MDVTIEGKEFERVLREYNQAKEHVTELQKRLTELVSEHRSGDLTYQVSEFHAAFGYPVRSTPQQCTTEELKFRLDLIKEEFLELLEACGVDSGVPEIALSEAIDECATSYLEGAVNLPDLADALGDLDYVVEGMRLTFGIPRLAVALEIQRSNMAKVGGGKDANGKQKKPEDWTPPDIKGVLRRFGWHESEG